MFLKPGANGGMPAAANSGNQQLRRKSVLMIEPRLANTTKFQTWLISEIQENRES